MNPIIILVLAAFFGLLIAFHHAPAENKNMLYKPPTDLTQKDALIEAIEEHNNKLHGGTAQYLQNNQEYDQGNQNVIGTTGFPTYLRHEGQIPQNNYQNSYMANPYHTPQAALSTHQPSPEPQQQGSYYPPLVPTNK